MVLKEEEILCRWQRLSQSWFHSRRVPTSDNTAMEDTANSVALEAVKQIADLLLYKMQCGDLDASEPALEAHLLHLENTDPSFHRCVGI